MSTPYGNNQGGYGGYGNPYAQDSNLQGGNPYPQMGYESSGLGGYPPSGGASYGGNSYGQNTGAAGVGYPPTSGGYPPQTSGFPHQSGGFPGQQPPYPSQGGYPGQQSPFLPQGGYPGGQQIGGLGMAPNAGGFPSNDQRDQRLNQILIRYEINPQIAPRLQALRQYEIVVICDDSGSMNTYNPITNRTRWDELKQIVGTVIDIASVMDTNGVDIYFLNRPPVLNVTNTQNISTIFNTPPDGLTPLVPVLRHVLDVKRAVSHQKKLLILIATDGEPTSETGGEDIIPLQTLLLHQRTPETYVTFLACTDDRFAINYLNGWDKAIPKLDVIDDYRSEIAEVQRICGPNFPFTYGDYIVKALLGSTDQRLDFLDETGLKPVAPINPINPPLTVIPVQPFPPTDQQLNQILIRYEINPQIAPRLQALRQYEIVVICDDSGSMNTYNLVTNRTRWDELKQIVGIAIDIGAVMDTNGIDIYFLNRPPVLNVTNTQNISTIFNTPPDGLTPLVPVLRRVLDIKRAVSHQKKLLILIATDGAPTNENGGEDIIPLQSILLYQRTPETYVTFLACTDDRYALNYLNGWDKAIPKLDVVDDYRSETAEIQRKFGPTFPFSYGDYVVKALLGSTDQRLDFLDEVR